MVRRVLTSLLVGAFAFGICIGASGCSEEKKADDKTETKTDEAAT